MKKILFVATLLPVQLFSMQKELAIQTEFSLTDLQNVRRKTDAEKWQLMKLMQEQFPLEKAVIKMSTLVNPQIIIWFSNYFGSVMKETVAWYKNYFFNPLPKATFWLTDLKAWALLSVEKRDLQKLPSYQPFIEKLEAFQRAKESTATCSIPALTEQECPLTTKHSDVLTQDIRTSSFAVLCSQDFFKWLLALKDVTILEDALVSKFCKTYVRDESLRFSLRDISYCPTVLNRITSNGVNILDLDFSLIFPLLQYLEGIYYAAKVIEDCAGKEKNAVTVVFLLPNKEFTYYTSSDEKPLFSSFREGLRKVLCKKTENANIQVTIHFQPFAFGDDFYDAPYKCNGKRVASKEVLLNMLKGQS